LSSDDVELLKVIEGGAARMASLISALLSYAQVGGRARRERKPINLEDVLRWSLMNLDESLRGAAARLTHDVLPVVTGDAEQITQLLQNLIGNSLKYRRPETPLTVHVSADREGNLWRFGVHDNGQGFEPAQAQMIFQAFQRLHGQDIPGTGIGLAICHRIVDLHGGRIWAESKGPGQGATFWFTLPVVTETSK
jgi:signal transduction histidine kinase